MSPKPQRSTRTVEPSTPLTPCLVQRRHTSGSSCKTTSSTSTSTSQSSAATSPHVNHTRRTSLPPPSPTISRENVTTIPLRSCCADCVPITEECIKEGEAWREKFSRAARRKRSASLDSGMSEEGKGSGFLAAVNVDEVDKIRKVDHFHSHSHPHKSRARDIKPDSPPANLEVNISHPAPVALKDRLHHSPSSLNAQELAPNPSPIPELEEDEDDQLFPLPSPRRTPTASPVPSPSASTSALVGIALAATNTSKDSLRSSIGSSSKGSDSSCNNSGRCEKGLLTPDGSLPSKFTREGSGDVEVLRGSPSLTSTRLTARNTIPKPISISSSPTPSPLSSATNSNFEERPFTTTASLVQTQTRTPSSSPQRSRKRKSTSFSIVVDVLKGVSAMGGSGM